MKKDKLIKRARAVGNTVLIPKLNEDLIAIRVQHTLLIKIYDIKKQKYVRQFLLEKGEDYFDGLDGDREYFDASLKHDSTSSSGEGAPDWQSERSRERPPGKTHNN